MTPHSTQTSETTEKNLRINSISWSSVLSEPAFGTASEAPLTLEATLTRLEWLTTQYRLLLLEDRSTCSQVSEIVTYHERLLAEMRDDFTPLYYKLGVFENILSRYQAYANSQIDQLTVSDSHDLVSSAF
jgi:hypothetical protein